MTPRFLTLKDVLELHEDQLKRYGGGTGIRDLGLLESAVAQAQASFGDEFLHADLFEMAAAYLFHICCNHPFIDGNKRTALLSALTFLGANGLRIRERAPALYGLTMAVARGETDKPTIAAKLRELCSGG